MHILNPGLFKHVMFYSYSNIFTELHILRHICPHSDIFRHIEGPDINGSNNVNQNMLFKSVSFEITVQKSIWNIFSFLCQK